MAVRAARVGNAGTVARSHPQVQAALIGSTSDRSFALKMRGAAQSGSYDPREAHQGEASSGQA